jgi:hypothetical protein
VILPFLVDGAWAMEPKTGTACFVGGSLSHSVLRGEGLHAHHSDYLDGDVAGKVL